MCYAFDEQTSAVVGDNTLRLKQPERPDVLVFNLPPPENAEELMTTFGYRSRRSEVVTIPLGMATQALALPITEGLTTPTPFVCETLVLEFDRALDLTINCVRSSQRFPVALATFFDGTEVVGTSPRGNGWLSQWVRADRLQFSGADYTRRDSRLDPFSKDA